MYELRTEIEELVALTSRKCRLDVEELSLQSSVQDNARIVDSATSYRGVLLSSLPPSPIVLSPSSLSVYFLPQKRL